MKKTALVLSLFVLSCLNVFAVSGEPVVKASLDKENAHIGDIIKYTVKAELPGAAYLAVNKDIIFENYETVNVSAAHLSEEPNIYVITFSLTAYETGILSLEPVGIAYVTASGDRKMFFTPRAKVLVDSVLNRNPEGIKDIKPLKKLKIKPKYIAGMILVLALLAVLIISLIKDAAKKIKKADIVVDPQTEALISMGNLLESGAIKNGEPRMVYYRMSEILRIYISKKYNFNAMEMTSTELLKKLETIVPVYITRRDLKDCFKIFDLARYAGFQPSETDMTESFEKTKEFIRKL